MRDVHKKLVDRYCALRDSRTGPVFFIEHGFTETDVEDLITDVRKAVEAHPIASGWWLTNSLPLIAVATEVGYRYRGSGTDYWPELEKELGTQINDQARKRIRDYFVMASKAYRGAQPPATPWAEAFHLVAWPITHALVPIEFHRPLALTLANLRVNVSELDDERLYRAIRVAAASSSARFTTLLKDAALIVSVARSLLGYGDAELSSEAMRRIANDLDKDRLARRSIAAAGRIQRTAPRPEKGGEEVRKPLQPVPGTLQLRRREDSLSLEAKFPSLDAQVLSQLRRALRRRRYAPRLWGVTARVPSEQLLSGIPFTLKLLSVPPDNAELLPGLDDLEIDERLREVLASLELEITPPLLFAVGADEELARQILGPIISGHRKYWVLVGINQTLAGLPTLGEIGPFIYYELDPSDETARDMLSKLGFIARFGVSVAFAGDPTLDRDASTPTFAAGDRRYVIPRRPYPDGLFVEVEDFQVRPEEDEVISLVVSPGDHLLRISTGSESREFSFKGISRPKTSQLSICDIFPRSNEMNVQSLLTGRLAFVVESYAPLEGLELTVEFQTAGRKVHASAPLDRVPCEVSPDVEPLKTLLEDGGTRDFLMQASSVEVRMSAGDLCARSWVLDQRIRPCWWSRSPDGSVTLMGELGELAVGEVAATAPHLPPSDELIASENEARLLAPIDLDTSEYGSRAMFTTFCVSPSRVSLKPPAIQKPRLVRRRRGDEGALGLEDLLESYLRWELGEGGTVIAEMRRRQVAKVLDAWVAELCCGEAWVRHEPSVRDADPWLLLRKVCHEKGLGRDSYVELTDVDEFEIARIAVKEIQHEYPDLWIRVGPPCELRAYDYEALDLACGRAYDELAARYEREGLGELAAEIAEGDPGTPGDEWETVLKQVKSSVELHPVAAMLFPTDTAHSLMSLEPSLLTFDDLAEEFSLWARDAHKAFAGGAPPAEALKVILALWIEPELALGSDWRGAIDIMIAERSVSRAARYLALRSRQSREGDIT